MTESQVLALVWMGAAVFSFMFGLGLIMLPRRARKRRRFFGLIRVAEQDIAEGRTLDGEALRKDWEQVGKDIADVQPLGTGVPD